MVVEDLHQPEDHLSFLTINFSEDPQSLQQYQTPRISSGNYQDFFSIARCSLISLSSGSRCDGDQCWPGLSGR